MKTFFAPMEGMTDSLFRQAHHDLFGAVSAYYIPFIRLTGDLKLTNGETREISPEENAAFPCVPQVLTKDADQLLWAGRMLGDLGYGLMDLNLGCPAPTVVTRGRGSALLKDPDALKRLFDRYFASCPLPLSVKTRIGFESPGEWPAILEVLADYPLARAVIHPRTREEQYAGEIHEDAFALAAERLGERAVWNGEVNTVGDFRRVSLRFPKIGGIMAGRGLVRDPSLFRRLGGGKAADRDEMKAFFTRLYRAYRERFGVTVALGRMKKLSALVCEGMADGRKLLKDVSKAAGEERYLSAAERMLDRWRAPDDSQGGLDDPPA